MGIFNKKTDKEKGIKTLKFKKITFNKDKFNKIKKHSQNLFLISQNAFEEYRFLKNEIDKMKIREADIAIKTGKNDYIIPELEEAKKEVINAEIYYKNQKENSSKFGAIVSTLETNIDIWEQNNKKAKFKSH